MAPSPPPAGSRPDLSRLLVALDYDGTVTDREYNERALQLLTGDAWRPFEEAARRGEIGHAECLDSQVGLVTASKKSSSPPTRTPPSSRRDSASSCADCSRAALA